MPLNKDFQNKISCNKVISKTKLFYNMKIPNSGFMEDINKINKQDKIFSVPVTQAINFTTHSHSKHKAVLQEKTVRSLKALNLHKVTQNPYLTCILLRYEYLFLRVSFTETT